MTKSKKIIELAVLAGLTVALTGCASMRAKTKKAPCASPSAGMTDPCGNAVPINSAEEIETIFKDDLTSTTI